MKFQVEASVTMSKTSEKGRKATIKKEKILLNVEAPSKKEAITTAELSIPSILKDVVEGVFKILRIECKILD